MNRRLILIVMALWLMAYAAHAQAPLSFGNHDAGAARKSLSNVTPATGRAALGLGTMAVATSTDYVATDTFTGHTGATGASVHGLGTISTKADTDYVATSALALRLDTVNASFSGDIDVVGDVGAATVNGVAPLTAGEKTQALVGSSTVDFLANAITVASFSYFGELSTGVKMKVLTGTTGSTEGNTASITHNLDIGKIVSFTCHVNRSGSYLVGPQMPAGILTEAEYDYYISPTHVVLVLSATNSGNILGKSIVATIWYKD